MIAGRPLVQVRRGSIVLVLVCVVVILVLLLGLAGSREVSSNLRTLQNFHTQRQVVMAANAAVEEVCARIENDPRFGQIPMPPVTKVARNLKEQLKFPQTYALKLARQDFLAEGLEIGDVVVESSDWVHRVWKQAAGWSLRREIGALQFTIPIQVKRAGVPAQQLTVIARRYVESSPEMGSNVCRLRIQASNMFLSVEQAGDAAARPTR